MIVTILEQIDDEMREAEEYIELAHACNNNETARLFLELAGEEINHAERLIKHCQRLADEIAPKRQDGVTAAKPEALVIWEWEKGKAEKKIAGLKAKTNNHKVM